MSGPAATGRVVIVVPVLGRPHRVVPLLESIEAATPEPHRVLFVADVGDAAERAALEAAGADHITIEGRGTYARKINLAARSSVEPLIFTAADDLHFHSGWFAAASAKLSGPVRVVGTNDLGNPRTMSGEHSTHTLIARSYVDDPGGVIDGRPGMVLHEGYPHEYCDDEFVQTAKARGVYAHALDAHVEHLHFLWGKAEDDATYKRGRSRSSYGRSLYRRRRRLWQHLARK